MLSRLAAIWRVPELWQKILLTIGLLAVYRLGFHISLPFINHEGIRIAQQKAAEGSGGGLTNVLQMMSLFSASNLTQGSLFGLGIMPYITASIVFQLLGTVYPPLEALQKEGESGRRRINEYTRYATVVICLLQSFFIVRGLESGLLSDGEPLVLEQYQSFGWYILGSLLMTCGTVFLMWIGEQIDTYGIGNGISLLIMAGILAQMPTVAADWVNGIRTNGVRIGTDQGIDKLLVMAVLFVGVIVCVIFITQGQRKIPIQSARHVRGRKVMGGQRQWLPLRVNQAGVMPIIFASSLLLLPFFILSQLAQVWEENAVLNTIAQSFTPGPGFIYNLTYIIMIYFFCYFWTAITFNPKDMADNLKDMGSFIPGYRPGARTAVHLEQVMTRVTYAGAAFLAIIAVIPTIISATLTNNDFRTASFFGGTGLLIIVSVALDLVQKIDSHLIMRNYPGLLDADE